MGCSPIDVCRPALRLSEAGPADAAAVVGRVNAIEKVLGKRFREAPAVAHLTSVSSERTRVRPTAQRTCCLDRAV